MYKLEVKRWLVEYKFPPKDGWEVTVKIHPMERAIGNQHKPDKKERVKVAEDALISMQASICPNTKYGQDILAKHPRYGSYIGVVEGISSKQKKQAIYSALGKLILHMKNNKYIHFIGVPDDALWAKELYNIPLYVRNNISLICFLVSEERVRQI